jgi:hypothetical protein
MRYLTDDQVWNAYRWTLYGTLALLILTWALGLFRQVRHYQQRSFEVPPAPVARRWWWISFVLGFSCATVMFVQAGFELPMLRAALSDLMDVTESSLLRAHYASLINDSLYNINLLLVMTFNVAVAFFCLRRNFWQRVASVALFVVSANFSLAKSQIAAALFVLMLFIALSRRIRFRTVAIAAVVIVLCIVPFYLLFAYSSNAEELVDAMRDRIIYGQWAGLPYYFALFRDHPFSPETFLPPYVQNVIGVHLDSPGRRLMLFMEPEAAVEGIAGNVPTFYLGEAFALGGIPAVVAAPFVVAVELWLVVFCFRLLPKNPFTTVLFSWFLYKFEVGVLGGFSVFMISGFTIVLAMLVGFVILREGARVPSYA